MALGKICICVIVSLTLCQGETFIPLREMEDLFDLDQHLYEVLNSYVKGATFELDTMKEHLKELSTIQSEVGSYNMYIENPVNTYSLIKRLVYEWPTTINFFPELQLTEKDLEDIPDKSVLKEMIARLVDWQIENDKETADIALGRVEGIEPHANLTAGDCYEIGVYCYETKRYQLAAEWLTESFRKIIDNKDGTVQIVKVLEFKFLAECFVGDRKTYGATFNSLQHNFANLFKPSKEHKREFKLDKVKQCTLNAAMMFTNQEIGEIPPLLKVYENTGDLCYSDIKFSHKLKCYLMNFLDPYLILGPSKLEEISHKPIMVMIHEVLSDNDILEIKESSLTQMKNLTMGENEPVQLKNEKLNFRIDQRMSSLANLKLFMMSRPNYVTLFGPGNNYTTFKDFIKEEKNLTRVYIDQLGKIIFFLNDVPKGGRVVFPSIKTAVVPQKGSALLWISPTATKAKKPGVLRGECPVLLGSKWVMTKIVRTFKDLQK